MTDWTVRGKTCVVTGANSGIGKHTAIALAQQGARVVMVCRSPERGEAARAEVASAAADGGEVELMQCDMASLDSIRALCAALGDRHDRLDVLVNNAGAVFGARELTADGYERTFQVNHLGYFAVTVLLRDLLVAAGRARVVSVASEAHKVGRLDFDNLQGERTYRQFRAYGTSKLCNIAFTYALARRLDGTGVTANCVHPGVVASSFGQSGSALMRGLVKIGRPFMLSNAKGARTQVYCATSPALDGVTGTYFARCKPARSIAASHDRDAQERLWALSEELTGARWDAAAG